MLNKHTKYTNYSLSNILVERDYLILRDAKLGESMWALKDIIRCSLSFLEKPRQLKHQAKNGGNSGSGLVKIRN